MSQYWRESLRSGVIESVTSRKIRVQSPVECVMNSIGFAPSPPWNPSQTRLARGSSAARKRTNLTKRDMKLRLSFRRESEEYAFRMQFTHSRQTADSSRQKLALRNDHLRAVITDSPLRNSSSNPSRCTGRRPDRRSRYTSAW